MGPVVVIGFYGTQLDSGRGPKRWSKWRPTVSLFQHEDLLIDRLELIVPAGTELPWLLEDIERLSPSTDVVLHQVGLENPWDFEEVYAALYDLALGREAAEEELLIHITTGTHVAQICLFLLAESRFLAGRLLQSAPPRGGGPPGRDIIDLDLARYDRIAQRFDQQVRQGTDLLKQGIPTRNQAFNELMEEIELVAGVSQAPILLLGPTGAGKSQLARRIDALKRARHQLRGPLVEVNCATLRGDQAMSALFGHRRGAFTGAVSDREGLLRTAHGGLLFLDEIGELGLDEQAMLLRAVEEGRFLPVGADREVQSDFQLIAGTNRDLHGLARSGRFREDLLARLDLWTFHLPGLAERREDIEPNLDYELEQFARTAGRRVGFNREAREAFLRFARSPSSPWRGNFRQLNAAVVRMATLSPGGRIDLPRVQQEQARLRAAWGVEGGSRVAAVLGEAAASLDRFDRVQLEDVLVVCGQSHSLSEAGRTLFAFSRTRRRTVNDADRLRKYLAKFGLSWAGIKEAL